MMRFVAEAVPSASRSSQVERLAPTNPFASVRYAEARRSGGESGWLFGLEADGELLTACFGFERRGRINRALEIPSLPAIRGATPFYGGLLEFCRTRHVTVLDLNSFASTVTDIPSLPREAGRHARLEWVLDLALPGPGSGLSSNHRRSIARARRLGVEIHRATDDDARVIHRRLMDASLRRRSARGESAALAPEAAAAFAAAATAAGGGEFFQARLEDQVVSSVLLLRARRGAYYHSSGSSAVGMQSGASAFLIASMAETLASEDQEVLNLGGAGPDNPGLYRFKSGFGARSVSLEAVTAYPVTFRHTPLAAMLHLGRHLLGGAR